MMTYGVNVFDTISVSCPFGNRGPSDSEVSHPSSDSIEYRSIDQLGRFFFSKPLRFMVERNPDGFVLSNEESDLIAFGNTLDEALDELTSMLEFDWEDIALEDDAVLSRTAMERKEWLLSNVRVEV